jgi:replicative DNA helicase
MDSNQLRKRLIEVSQAISNKAQLAEDEDYIFQVLDEATAELFAIEELQSKVPEWISLENEIKLFEDKLPTSKGKLTGFNTLDEYTGGLRYGDLVLIAGMQNVGKTALALNIVESLVTQGNAPIGIFSTNKSARELCQRLISSLCRIDISRIRSGELDDTEQSRLTEARNKLSGRLYVRELTELHPIFIRAESRRLRRKHNGLGAIIVDRIHDGFPIGKSNKLMIATLQSLKDLAMELKCPIVVLARIHHRDQRDFYQNESLSGSSQEESIFQMADLALILTKESDWSEKGYLKVSLDLNKHGPTGQLLLKFNRNYVTLIEP